MAKGFTPIIGLAVVVALAMAAVFGSMSLTPAPAHAQATAPMATATEMVYTEYGTKIDLAKYFRAGTATISSYMVTMPTPDRRITISLGNTPLVYDGDANDIDQMGGKAEVTIMGVEGAQMSAATFMVTAVDNHNGTDPKVTVTVNVMESMPAMAKTGDDLDVMLYTDHARSIDLSDFFSDMGSGAGMIESYTVSAAPAPGTSDGANATTDFMVGTITKGMLEFTGESTTTMGVPDTITIEAMVADATANCCSDVEAPLMVTVMESTPTEKAALNLSPRTVDAGRMETIPYSILEGAFDPGDGTGMIKTFRFRSDNPSAVRVNPEGRDLMITGVSAGEAMIAVEAIDEHDDDNAVSTLKVTVPVKEVPITPPPSYAPTFEADDLEPGKNSWYTLEFHIDQDFNGGLHDMTIKLEEFGVPSSISSNQIAIEVTEPDHMSYTFNPAAVGIDGDDIIITIPNVAASDEPIKKDFKAGSNFKVILRQGAGISNPTRSNTYGGDDMWEDFDEDRRISVDFAGSLVSMVNLRAHDATDGMSGVTVPRVVILDEEDGGLDDEIGVSGLGFENGGTLHFFVDEDVDGILDTGEDILCSVETVSDNAGSCTFTVTTPTFSTGMNYVNAVDGDGKMVTNNMGGDNVFTLKASIRVTPAGGSPGEVMQVQLVSFPANSAVTNVKLSGKDICGGNSMTGCNLGGVGAQGTGSIAVSIPNWAVEGVQELKVVAGNEDDDAKVTIVGPRIVSTPNTVVANQRVSLVGTGFSPSSELGNDTTDTARVSKISIGGYPIPWEKVNDGRNVEVDDGGNWSASVDLPLVEATTGSGERLIRVTDSKGRTGSIAVTMQERTFTITPERGRVGTLAVIRGEGYPGKNDEGHSFTVDVVYKVQEGSEARVSVVPDASGRFEVQMRIPTTASIPSTNQVEVKFDHEAGGGGVLETEQHFVPEGVVTLSQTSGGPGSTITVSGEGFKTFVPVENVKLGTIEVTPSPKPHTDVNGMLEFDVLIPGLDVGIQTLEVQVGGTTSSTGFTVTESGVNPGDIRPVAEAIEPLGDNLVVAFHFNNDTKMWSFHSTDPEAAEANTLTHMVTGESYLLQIKASQEVILNRDTRSLTCVEGNCWNQVVW